MPLVSKMGSMTSQLCMVQILWAFPYKCGREIYRKSPFMKKNTQFSPKKSIFSCNSQPIKLKFGTNDVWMIFQKRCAGILKILILGWFLGVQIQIFVILGQNVCCVKWPNYGIKVNIFAGFHKDGLLNWRTQNHC